MVTEYHLTYFIQLSEQSKTQCNFNAKQRKGKKFLTPLVDTAVLTLTDWERIRRNAFMPSKEEELTSKRIETEQRDAQLAKARALRETFVEEFSGMYDESEMPAPEPKESKETVEAEIITQEEPKEETVVSLDEI